MQKNTKSVVLGRRAWNFLRLALLWARKGGVFKKSRMTMDHLRLMFPKLVKTLRHLANHHHHKQGALRYGERELSFDDTPVIHIKMHRPSSLRFKIPCINPPQLDFACDFDDHYYNNNPNDAITRKSFPKGADDDDYQLDEDEYYYSCGCSDICEQVNNEPPPSCDDEEGIDLKAEQFIAKFYQQIKLQRQISYLQHNEMIN
ncbi:hypothetical protein ACH5RR_010842 [Cinchona calisaya]|uniref:Uncharacterized protein n=1 Tax=Cinchona calisaya TaxID=153742 RepID=A0ABD3AK25_9GENT